MESCISIEDITVSRLGLAPEQLHGAVVPTVAGHVVGVIQGRVEVGIDGGVGGQVLEVHVRLAGVPHGQAESVVGAVVVGLTVVQFIGRYLVFPACQ